MSESQPARCFECNTYCERLKQWDEEPDPDEETLCCLHIGAYPRSEANKWCSTCFNDHVL